MARLVGSDVAMASARSSLNSLNSNSPGVQLAARHCFLLEDPPDDLKGPAGPNWYIYVNLFPILKFFMKNGLSWDKKFAAVPWKWLIKMLNNTTMKAKPRKV